MATNKKWFFTLTEDVSPTMNMALDSIMWDIARLMPNTAILRFYTWKPSGVSLGANQKPNNIVDVEFCKKNNIPIVARITGGSAIFHDKEITYSFSAANDEKFFLGPLSSYEKICNALKTGLKNLGIDVQWRGVSIGKEPSLTNRDCFSLSTRHDLVIDGRKIIGSAQRKDKTSFLQHGSLLIEVEKELWNNIFLEKPDFSKVICLSEILSYVPDFKSVLSMLIKGFEEFFEHRFEIFEFSSKDIERAKKIENDFLLT